MKSYLDAAADLLLGATCPGCRSPGLRVCARCAAAVDVPPQPIHRGLGVVLVAAAPYRPVLEHVIPRYKDDGALHLDGWLAGLLVRAVSALQPPGSALLVPMPSLAVAVRRRGFDHSLRLAHVAARRTGLGAGALLRRTRAGEDQRGLGRGQRRANLDGALTASFSGRPVILVDDVATTGASLREGERALRAAGVALVGAAVVAAADN